MDEDKESILYQEKVMEEYCERNNIEIVRQFSDIGYSGKTIQRPELLEMLELIESEEVEIDVLLFYTVDRLGRDFRNNISLILEVSKKVKEVVFVNEGMTNTYEYFKMFLMMKSVMAEEDRIAILNRVLRGRKTAVVDRGKFRGQYKPLGYVQKNKKELVLATIDHTKDFKKLQTLEEVQFIFEGYLANLSIREITRKLNERFGLTGRGKKWDAKSVSYILRNDIYAGILSGEYQNEKYYVESPLVEPLLPKEIYYYIQKKLELEKPGRKPINNILPQLSVCMECLKPLLTVESDIACPSCRGRLNKNVYIEEVKTNLASYLLGNFNQKDIEIKLRRYRKNLFLKIKGLEERIKELSDRKFLIKEMFYDDKKLLEMLITQNEKEQESFQRELEETQSFFEFLFGNEKHPDVNLQKYLDSTLLLQIPYLILVDLESKQVYVKFHSCVFEEKR